MSRSSNASSSPSRAVVMGASLSETPRPLRSSSHFSTPLLYGVDGMVDGAEPHLRPEHSRDDALPPHHPVPPERAPPLGGAGRPHAAGAPGGGGQHGAVLRDPRDLRGAHTHRHPAAVDRRRV